MEDMLHPYQWDACEKLLEGGDMASRTAIIPQAAYDILSRADDRTKVIGIFAAGNDGMLRLVRRDAPDRFPLPGGHMGPSSNYDSRTREMDEEAGGPRMQLLKWRPPSARNIDVIAKAVAAIGSRHPDARLRVETQDGGMGRTMFAIMVGDGTEAETFAVREVDENAELLALVVRHLDAWLLSRRTTLAVAPKFDRRTTAAARTRGTDPLMLDEMHMGPPGLGKTYSQTRLARFR